MTPDRDTPLESLPERDSRSGALVVLGAPGAGKTTVGQKLAARLGVPFFDVDQVIEAEQGKLIREIFADSGEPYFREVEREATLRCLKSPGVVALGGGAVLTPAIREALRTHEVVWLKVSVPQATRRIGFTQARPLLLGNVRGQLIKLLAERTPVYEAVATITVDTDHATPGQLVTAIVAQRQGVTA